MNKTLVTLCRTPAATTGASAQSSALDTYQTPAIDTSGNYVVGISNHLVSYNCAGNDGSPNFVAPQGGIDHTATGSIKKLRGIH